MKRCVRTLSLAAACVGVLSSSSALAGDADKLTSRIQELRAKYATTMGMYDQLRADVETLSVLPNAKELSGISGDQFKSALTACFEAPVEKVEGVKRNAIDIKRAAASFKDRAAMRELQDTQTEVTNARSVVKGCKEKAMSTANPNLDGMNDAAKTALDGKISIVDQIRILTKHELPERSKAMTEDAAKLQGEVLAAIKKAEGAATVAAKNPFGGGGKKEKEEVQRLKQTEVEAKELQELVTREMSQVPQELGKTGAAVLQNITNLSALIGK